LSSPCSVVGSGAAVLHGELRRAAEGMADGGG